MKRSVKILSVICCVLLCFAVVLSASLVIHSADHDCIGENCHVCHFVSLQKELMSVLGVAGVGIFISFGLVACVILITDSVGKARKEDNLITCKVKITA